MTGPAEAGHYDTLVEMKRFLLILPLLFVVACGGDDDGNGTPTGPTGPTTTTASYSQTDLVVGTGTAAITGSNVTVAYSGWLHDSTRADAKGTLFDSGSITFQLGTGRVIRGWDLGIVGMRVGGQRRLVIPPDLAYGSAGSPPRIGPNNTLVFDVTLNAVQ